MEKEVEGGAEVPLVSQIRGRSFVPLDRNRGLLVPLANPAANLKWSEKPPSPSPSSVLGTSPMRQHFVFSSRPLILMLAEDLIQRGPPWVPDQFLMSSDRQADRPEKFQSDYEKSDPFGMPAAVAVGHSSPEVAGSLVRLYNRKLEKAVQFGFVRYARCLDWQFDSGPL
jgi:hypothetical protein